MSREKESREGVQVEKERGSASREGMRVEMECD